jgi:hypothetical protein
MSLFQAARAQLLARAGKGFETAPAELAVAGGAAGARGSADVPVTVRAGRNAIAAEWVPTALAAAKVVRGHPVAAAAAADPLPAIDGDVGAGRVVGFEDLAHEHKKI